MSRGAGRSPWRAGTSISIAVPASSANLGPGFDSVGVGLEVLDRCTVTIDDRPGVHVTVTGQGDGEVPCDERHLVVRALRRAWRVLGVPEPAGLRLVCHNAVPHGRGMGSSATAIVTGVGAAYGLASLADGDVRLDLDAINDLAAELEGHPDNSSASVYGGLTLSWGDDAPTTADVARTRTLRLRPHAGVAPVVLVPDVQLSTATARSVLPAHVRLGDAAANSARTALLVYALTADPDLLVPATRDYLHQEARRPSYAASMALVDHLRRDDHAAVISGAGPSVLVLARVPALAEVTACTPPGWRALTPGFAPVGIRVLDAVAG